MKILDKVKTNKIEEILVFTYKFLFIVRRFKNNEPNTTFCVKFINIVEIYIACSKHFREKSLDIKYVFRRR